MTPPLTKAALQTLIDQSPFTAMLEFNLLEADPEKQRVSIQAPVIERSRRMNSANQIHGGVLAALADVAGDLAVAQTLGGPVPTIDLKVDYLRPATGEVIAVATARRIGKTVAVADIEISDADGRLCALARAVYASRMG